MTYGVGQLDSRSPVGKCQSQSHVCCSKKDNIARKKPVKCGIRNRDGLCYQFNEQNGEAKYAEFPWMAALLTENASGKLEFFCGGSLIHPRVVLTGAHCVHDKNVKDLMVRLGEWDPQTENEIFAHDDHKVNEIVVHKEFGPANLFNDIALLVLRDPAQLSLYINTVCLPPQNFKADQSKCVASGWGTDKFGHEGIYRANLKKKDLPLVPLRDCQDRLRKTKLGPLFRIHQSFMCAGGEENVDTCTGDGGSPLVCQVSEHTDQYYQHGIVSWGMDCGQKGVPGVYANAAKFRTWIDKQMEDLGFSTESYTAKYVNVQDDNDYSFNE
jgi:plasma kallikrein